jgi:hypothetical protein
MQSVEREFNKLKNKKKVFQEKKGLLVEIWPKKFILYGMSIWFLMMHFEKMKVLTIQKMNGNLTVVEQSSS